MDIVYFTGRIGGEDDPLLRAIKLLANAGHVLGPTTAHEFTKKITESRSRQLLAIMRPCDEDALIDMYFARCLLKRVPSMLVLPDHQRDTAALAFRVGPTRIFPCGTPPGKVAAAVSAILGECGTRGALSVNEYRGRRAPRDCSPVFAGDRVSNY